MGALKIAAIPQAPPSAQPSLLTCMRRSSSIMSAGIAPELFTSTFTQSRMCGDASICTTS